MWKKSQHWLLQAMTKTAKYLKRGLAQCCKLWVCVHGLAAVAAVFAVSIYNHPTAQRLLPKEMKNAEYKSLLVYLNRTVIFPWVLLTAGVYCARTLWYFTVLFFCLCGRCRRNKREKPKCNVKNSLTNASKSEGESDKPPKGSAGATRGKTAFGARRAYPKLPQLGKS